MLAAAAAEDGARDVIVVGIDEVGRGALAGPVVMGACAVLVRDGAVTTPLPEGIRDSKALTARRREVLCPPIRESAHAWSLGWASAAEIDAVGIVPALTRAALRALDALALTPDAIILDGSIDVLSAHLRPDPQGARPRVHLQVRADRDCASVAAASILAKVARDSRMVELAADAPAYGWERNKGYGAAAHRAAIIACGPHLEHRRSWNLTGGADVLWGPDSGARGRSDGRQEAIS